LIHQKTHKQQPVNKRINPETSTSLIKYEPRNINQTKSKIQTQKNQPNSPKKPIKKTNTNTEKNPKNPKANPKKIPNETHKTI
jgi:hypothetical protein